MFIELFELFYVGFGMAIASFSPNALLASLLVPLFFTFITSFCGVVVPAMGLPEFWHAWMYWLTPFHYLLEAMLGLVVHNVPVRCQENELARFPPPPGLTCQQYAGPYAQQAGGYVETLADGLCGFCQYANGDQFVSTTQTRKLINNTLTNIVTGRELQCLLHAPLAQLRHFLALCFL